MKVGTGVHMLLEQCVCIHLAYLLVLMHQALVTQEDKTLFLITVGGIERKSIFSERWGVF